MLGLSKYANKLCVIGMIGFSIIAIGCGNNEKIEPEVSTQCASYKNYASATFEVNGDMNDLIEKVAKKALTRSCFKKSDTSTANLRIKIESKATLNTETGFIQNKYDNTLQLMITAIMLVPTDQGGLTTLTSKQEATLNLKAKPIADIGGTAELSKEEVVPFVEQNVAIALENLFKDM